MQYRQLYSQGIQKHTEKKKLSKFCIKYTPPSFDLILAEKKCVLYTWLYSNGFNVAHVSNVAYEPHVPIFSPCFITFSPSLQLSIVNKHLHSDGMWRPKEKNDIIMSLNSGFCFSHFWKIYVHIILNFYLLLSVIVLRSVKKVNESCAHNTMHSRLPQQFVYDFFMY